MSKRTSLYHTKITNAAPKCEETDPDAAHSYSPRIQASRFRASATQTSQITKMKV